MSVPGVRVECRLLLVLAIVGVILVGVLGSAPPVWASATTGVCDRAVALVQKGALEDAEALAAAVGGKCPGRIGTLTTQAREASDTLVEQATRDSDKTEQRRLAQLAVDLDGNNGEANALLEDPAAEQHPGLCAGADAAVERGEFARAEALYAALDGVEGAKACRQSGLAGLADARASAWPQRVKDAVTEDGLLLLLFAAIAFGIGVAVTMWRRPRRLPFGGSGVVGLTLLTFFCLGAWHLWSSNDTLALFLLGLVLLLALVTGFAASTLSRSHAPLRIEVGSGEKDDEQGGAIARHTVTQLHDLANGQSRGIFALTGTDLHDTRIRGVFGALPYAWLATLLKVWDAVVLRSGDRVLLTTDGPVTSVAMYEGRRLVLVRSVNADGFRVDPAMATDSEQATIVRNVATGVAALLLWWRLPDPAANRRLYGASEASGLALATIAAQRLEDKDFTGARALAARAEHRDPGNRAAVLTLASADLFGTPSAAVEDLRLHQLEELLRKEERAPGGDSPLAWRVRYTLAVGLVNREVSRRPTLEGQAWRGPFVRALRLWASFLAPAERDGLPLDPPDAGVDAKVSFPESLTPQAGEEDLWRYLVEASRSAALSVAVALRSQPGGQVDTSQLDAWKLVGSHTAHRNLASGYATAYHLTSSAASDLRQSLASRCVQQIRLGAPEPRQRAGVLADPFLAWVKDSDPYRELLTEWDMADGTYAGIGSFGRFAAALARSHPVPADLLAVLDTSAGPQAFRSEYKVDGETLRAWRGAAQWLEAGADGSLIDRYQRAGFADRDRVRRTQDTVVARRLAASAAVSGTKEPSAEDRAAMRGEASTSLGP
ncbi:MAG: hypothetical protein Q4P07_07015 [Ornithinimicrobium sp.]|uniref:hypothetical protein n=1 Tax=Ornithinimicrobium sp. TaxID=1977084 RepID=UPI0026DEF07B|nr:hypothetical protein [Ornithinimicrobium sp.]MDO5739884.1 hypothetical protein [Ornithinimicrobium sp.]